MKSSNQEAVTVDFNAAMFNKFSSYGWKYSKSSNKKELVFLKQLFDKNVKGPSTNELRIPLIIHQIWVGPHPFPAPLKKFQETWQALHPEWVYILWTDENVKTLDLINRQLYESTNDYREKADILRLELLYQFGGIYADLDFKCLKPFDSFHYLYDFYVGIAVNNVNEILANGLVASAPGHPILYDLIHSMEDNHGIKDWREKTGVFYFSRQCLKSLKTAPGINIALPTSYFYPQPFAKKYHGETWKARPETMAVHIWKAGK